VVATRLKVYFLFASAGLGGAERSMLRLMSFAHPRLFDCSLVLCGSRNPPFSEAAHALGIPVLHAGVFGGQRLYRALLKDRPDVVYVFGTFRTLPWAMVARMARIPLILGSERACGGRPRDRLARLMERPLFDGYVANSKYSANAMSRYMNCERVFVVYNGIEANHTPPPPCPDSIRGIEPYAVCVANLRPIKGQLYLLRAVNILRRQFPSLRAVLVGQDFTSGRLFQAAEKESLTGTFLWTGFLSDVRGVLAGASAFVLPSLTEGMPTAILEAMLAGLPVVASNVGGIPELVEEDETGFIVPPGDPQAIAERLAFILREPEKARIMGERGRARAEKCFGMEVMANGHLHAMRTLLHHKSRRRKGPLEVE
jgi:glycosyltransferase involved in cell wall biosynthesis